MKHFRFTVQFLLLLMAIPLLMYVELTRKIKQQPKDQAEPPTEVAYHKKAVASVDTPIYSFGQIK